MRVSDSKRIETRVFSLNPRTDAFVGVLETKRIAPAAPTFYLLYSGTGTNHYVSMLYNLTCARSVHVN